MKSYFLGIVVAVALSAIYVTYNTAEITINYPGFQAVINQGVWDVFLFGAGAVIMWLLSLGASLETYTANKKRIKELNQKIEDIEKEKKSLLAALQNVGHPKAERTVPGHRADFQANVAVPSHEVAADIFETDRIPSDEPLNAEQSPETNASEVSNAAGIKTFFSSIFKSDRKPESAETFTHKTEVRDEDEAEFAEEFSDSHENEIGFDAKDGIEAEENETAEEIESGHKFDAEYKTGENTEAETDDSEKENDDPHNGGVCEIDIDDDETAESEDDSGEKQDDGEIFRF